MKKTKVLHITTHLNTGGITTYIYLLAEALKNTPFEIVVLSSGGNMTEQFRQAGIRTFEIPYRTKSELSPKLYRAIPRASELVRKEGIELIHSHTRVTQVLSWWIEKITKVPYVSTCHGFYKRRLGRQLLPAWGRKVVAISDPVADSLKKDFRIPEDRVVTIYNAIDAEGLISSARAKDRSKIINEWNLASHQPVVGIVSRIVQDKGHEYLIRAFAILREKYPDIKLLIVGEGPYKKNLERLVQSLNLKSGVILIGNLKDVTKALTVIDIFVLPAIWREGFGLSIIEAMALKKPVIVTNIWALNAIVAHRVNGLLIEPRDIKAIVEAVTELIEDQKLCQQIGENAYQTAIKEFSIDRMAHQMANFYDETLRRPANGAI